MKYLLGIDFGGGSSKATLIDTTGNIIQENTVEYPTSHPNLGWCEQAPEDWSRALSENVKELLKKKRNRCFRYYGPCHRFRNPYLGHVR